MSSPGRRLTVILLGVSIAACSGQAGPTATAPSGVTAPPAAANASAGCYPVQFQAVRVATPAPGTSTFALSGDIEGTLQVTFDMGSIKYSGPPPVYSGGTMTLEGVGVWTITGGIVPGLATFQTTLRNRNMIGDRPGSPAYVAVNLGTHRAASGVALANLSYKGTADSSVVPPSVVHAYWGVICP